LASDTSAHKGDMFGRRSSGPPDLDRPFTVLVVDDDPDTLASLRQALENGPGGPLVLAASTGTQALEFLRGAAIDLVLTDYRMSQVDGLQVLVDARRLAPKAARVLMTAFLTTDVALTAINDAGVTYVLAKPFELQSLTDLVESIRSERRKDPEQDVSASLARSRS
jgi:DNA-binding NtrC family response regulator